MRESIAYADQIRVYTSKSEWPLLAMLAINTVFAASVVFAWAFVALVVSEPLAWATWMPVGRNWRPGMLEYPFTLLWALPVAGIVSAWTARKSRNMPMANFCAGLPIVTLVLMFGWYYLTPLDWH